MRSLVILLVCAAALVSAEEMEKPRIKPIIIGGKETRPVGAKPLKLVIVPKGDPRARGGASPFALPGQSPASTLLRASTPMASVTAAQLVSCMPGLSTTKANTVLPYLNAAQAAAEINTCDRTAAWLAQLGHESGSLQYMEEIASGAAYEGRRDLGNTQPGDGKRFKGRGPIQLTGRANYAAAGKALGLDLINNPTSVATYPVGFRTSAWFWTSNGLNALADQGAFSSITRKINGGTNGASDRNMRWGKCKTALACGATVVDYPACTAQKGKCQTTTCDGTVVRGLCGAGAATCCVPKSTVDPFPGCTAQKGKCQTTTCSGTIVRGLCGAGAETCCVPKLLQASGPAARTPVVGSKGLDISQPLTSKVAACLKTNGQSWISIRAGRSTGKPDTNAVNSIKVARAAGFAPADISVYIFPMSKTPDASSGGRQVTAMWNALASVKNEFSTIWIDIEAAAWMSPGQNQKFFESMVAACRATGKTCGVYTSKVFWTQIMGPTYAGGASLPLWYPHYNNAAAMTDFRTFGGWTSPWAKQWKGDTTICGMGADLNVKNSAWAGVSAAPTTVLRAPATTAATAAAAASASDITVTQLVNCMSGLSSKKAAQVLPFINAAQKWASINTCKRKAAWLAQLGHESGSLLYMQELASGAAYEGRGDLGNTQPGDGKRFKGRGPIQLTGRANYAAAGKALGLNLIANPGSVATNDVGFRTSAWFWSSKGLNALADQGAFSSITRKINGGTNGAADRNKRWAACKKALKC